MRAVQKWGDGRDAMGLVDVPEPIVGPHDLLVEVGAVGICGSDLHIWNDRKEHRRPVTLGHEFSGVIIGRGAEVADAAGRSAIASAATWRRWTAAWARTSTARTPSESPSPNGWPITCRTTSASRKAR